MSSVSLALLIIFLLLLAGMFGMQVLGYRYGKRKFAAQSAGSNEGLGVVEGAMFALLGLILAFQFSNAANRIGQRRDLAIKEANAIGTAYLRLDLLTPDDAAIMRELFRRYVELRIRVKEAMPDLVAADREQTLSEKMQQEIWSTAIASCRKQPGQEAELLLLPALNDMIDVSAERKAVALTHTPFAVQAF